VDPSCFPFGGGVNPNRLLRGLFTERRSLRDATLPNDGRVELERRADQLGAARLRRTRMRSRDGLRRLAPRVRDDLRRQPFDCGDLMTPQSVGGISDAGQPRSRRPRPPLLA
jgi:hypothetical protein